LAPLTPNVEILIARNWYSAPQFDLEKASVSISFWPRLRDVVFEYWYPQLIHLSKTIKRLAVKGDAGIFPAGFVGDLETKFPLLTEVALCFKTQAELEQNLDNLSRWTKRLKDVVFSCCDPECFFVNKRAGFVHPEVRDLFPNIVYTPA
jgi:hypothetical protein